jgi:predicted dehydrogenase
MKGKTVRWGILGTANIAHKNWKAIRLTGNGVVTTVASRDLERSRRFISECQSECPFETPPAAMGNYEDLLASPEVDAVYIPLPTALRREWVLRAAAAGKHVVCEKPCGIDQAEVRAMIDACRKHRVQFMDGVMFMHSRRLEELRSVLDDGSSVGTLKRLTAQFSFGAHEAFLTENIRLHSGLEPHGCLGDLGWYCIRLFLWTMGWNLPQEVSGRLLSSLGRSDSPEAVPTDFSAELLFPGGVSAGFYCSFLAQNQEWAVLSGTKGYVRIEDFVLPYFGSEVEFEVNNAVYNVQGCEFNMEKHAHRQAVPEYSNSHPSAQECRLFRNFAEQILSGRLNEDWPEFAFKTQQVVDACLRSARAGGQRMPVG